MWPFKTRKDSRPEPAEIKPAEKLYAPYFRLAEVPNRELYDKVCELFRTMEPEYKQELYPGPGPYGYTSIDTFLFPQHDHCVEVEVTYMTMLGGRDVIAYTVGPIDGDKVPLCKETREDVSHREPTNVSELHDLVDKREKEAKKRKADERAAKAMAAVDEALGRR